VAYQAICRHGVLSGRETVSPGKCKMPLRLVTFNTTQDKKESVQQSHKGGCNSCCGPSHLQPPQAVEAMPEPGRVEAALRFRGRAEAASEAIHGPSGSLL